MVGLWGEPADLLSVEEGSEGVMASIPRLTAAELAEAMRDAALDRIRVALHARIMEKIEPDIQASIDAMMETFELKAATWKSFADPSMTIKFLIEDRREAKGS